MQRDPPLGRLVHRDHEHAVAGLERVASMSGWSYAASAISAPPRSGRPDRSASPHGTARRGAPARGDEASDAPAGSGDDDHRFEGTPAAPASEDLGAPRGTLDPEERVRAREPSPRALLRPAGARELREREAAEVASSRAPWTSSAHVRAPRRALRPGRLPRSSTSRRCRRTAGRPSTSIVTRPSAAYAVPRAPPGRRRAVPRDRRRRAAPSSLTRSTRSGSGSSTASCSARSASVQSISSRKRQMSRRGRVVDAERLDHAHGLLPLGDVAPSCAIR